MLSLGYFGMGLENWERGQCMINHPWCNWSALLNWAHYGVYIHRKLHEISASALEERTSLCLLWERTCQHTSYTRSWPILTQSLSPHINQLIACINYQLYSQTRPTALSGFGAEWLLVIEGCPSWNWITEAGTKLVHSLLVLHNNFMPILDNKCLLIPITDTKLRSNFLLSIFQPFSTYFDHFTGKYFHHYPLSLVTDIIMFYNITNSWYWHFGRYSWNLMADLIFGATLLITVKLISSHGHSLIFYEWISIIWTAKTRFNTH